MSADLEHIWTACDARMSGRAVAKATSLGIPPDTFKRKPCLGATAAHLDQATRSWQPVSSHEGTPVLVVPLGDRAPHDMSLESLDDLLAFEPDKPERWYWLHGGVPILTPEALDKARHFEEPVRLHSTPLAWLKADCEGAVVLDWDSICAPMWFGQLQILADTEVLQRRLLKELVGAPIATEVRNAA